MEVGQSAINYAQQSPASAQRAAGGIAKTVNPSCFGNVEDVSAHSSLVAQNVERLVERLCGVEPNGAETSRDPMPPTNGLFDEADRQARYIRFNLARIEAAMNRLEKSLP